MQRILIVGGGVGGTLTANLLVKRLRRQVTTGDVEVIVVDAIGAARLPAGLHVHRDGRRTGRQPHSAGAVAPRQARHARRRRGRRPSTRRPRTVTLTDGLHARLRPARPRHRVAHRARGDRALRHRGPSLLHGRGRRPAARRRSTHSRAAASSSASPGCRTSARRRRWRWRSSSNPSCASAACATGRRSTSARPSGAPSPSKACRRWRRRSSRRRGSSCTRSSTSRPSTPTARWS